MQAAHLTLAPEADTLFFDEGIAVSSLSSAESSKRARWPFFFLFQILPEYQVLGQPLLRLKPQDLSIGFEN
jgi:hypothetical protein